MASNPKRVWKVSRRDCQSPHRVRHWVSKESEKSLKDTLSGLQGREALCVGLEDRNCEKQSAALPVNCPHVPHCWQEGRLPGEANADCLPSWVALAALPAASLLVSEKPGGSLESRIIRRPQRGHLQGGHLKMGCRSEIRTRHVNSHFSF